MTSKNAYLTLIAGLTVLHLVVAAAVPLSGDEVYYWDCSRHVDWAYFDQPGLMIWTMIPFRMILGESAVAVRMPAVLVSLLSAFMLVPLIRRLGGGWKEAGITYALLHATPIYFVGSFYASTDAGLVTAYLGAVWAAVAIAQGSRRAWWGFGLAMGLGFLAKFPIVVAVLLLLPVLARREGRQHLTTPTPYLAAVMSLVLTLPVWIWAWLHQWSNIAFQLQGRHAYSQIGLKYTLEFIGALLLLAGPVLGVTIAIAWFKRLRCSDPAWQVIVVAVAGPLLVFGFFSLWSRVGPHWGGPAVLVGMVILVFSNLIKRKVLIVIGASIGVLISLATLTAVWAAEPLSEVEWSYAGRPGRISTGALKAVIGNDEMTRAVQERTAEHEIVASESYTLVHLLAFLSNGELTTRLARVRGGDHGLASLYWYKPAELVGADVVFVSERSGFSEKLEAIFERVDEEAPIEIVRGDRVIRTIRVLRCRNLLQPKDVFTRRAD
ncbi:MAG: hypothetical protein GY906_21980 [bacterium]|nr:hypothetical protein [bacterium]